MMNKKAQGLSVNVVIVAAIALIILVVLIAIFAGRFAIFNRGVDEATSCEQICVGNGYSEGKAFGEDDTVEEGYKRLLGARDADGNQCYCKK